MRILLTGNEGYIGCVLAPMLQAAGHQVTGLDAGLFEECVLTPFRKPPTLRKDIRSVEASDVAGADAVIHLAGLANDPLGDLAPPVTYEINHEATVRIAELAKKVGVRRFLYASTCSVYGAAGEDLINEEAEPNPVTPYARSKMLSEADLKRLADSSFCPVYLRAATAYGVSPYLRFDLAINNLVAWAYTTKQVYLKSDGMSWRPLVHIRDIAHAYIVLLDAPTELVHNQAFNVGQTKENYRIRSVAEIVRDTVEGTELVFADDASPDKRSYRVDCERICRTLPQFKPEWTARAGVEEVHRVIRERGLRAEDFEGPRYNRIAHIRELLNKGRLDDRLYWTWLPSELRQAAE